ncbi:YcgL domain-containing protein [Cellvibrio fontiphilus]|uniref:YcgL domain-containing protein ACFODX_15820 n=1 Tax=Cellvibrio fontiphilus TaxID=1815559 RepID=A0ABV7FJT7_9GAMM|nr:YcgL domain-containing protein [Cellvibrio fontiphilus]
MKIICEIYRSPKEEGMYLYVKKDEGLTRVPEDLLKLFGRPQQAMVLLLTPGKKLAHASVEKVAESLETQGFYLQLPPRNERDPEAERLRALNSKLSGH